MLGRFLLLVCLLACLLLSGKLSAQDAMKWSNADGKEIVGEFVRMEGKTVVLRLENGKEAKVPLSSLSFESHLQALKLGKPEAFNKEMVKAPVIVAAAKLPFTYAPLSVMTSPFESDPKIDGYMRTFVDEVNRGNLFVAWHMLPPKMQTDLAALISREIQNIGPTFPSQMKKIFVLLSSIASKKKDWIFDPVVTGKQLTPEEIAENDANWPYVIAFLEGLAEPSIWDNSFRPETIPNFLAAVLTNYQFVVPAFTRHGTLNYSIMSESADRAEVEFSIGPQKLPPVSFQKVGKIWVSPDLMNEMRKTVDNAMSKPANPAVPTMFAGVMTVLMPVLNKLDSAKTKEEFKKTLDTFRSKPGAMPALPGFSFPGLTPPPGFAPPGLTPPGSPAGK